MSLSKLTLPTHLAKTHAYFCMSLNDNANNTVEIPHPPGHLFIVVMFLVGLPLNGNTTLISGKEERSVDVKMNCIQFTT